MRDLLLLGIFVVAIPFALRHTWIGVLLWTWISIMNPHRLAYGFAHYAPFAAIAAGVTLLSLVITRDKLRMPWTPPVVVLFLFVIWMCVTTALAIDPAGSWESLSKVLKIQIMTAVALMALHERRHIELFLWVNALSVGFYGFKGGIFTIATGGGARVWGPPGGFFEGNNELAVATVMIIPLLNYLRVVSTRSLVRHALLVLMLLCTISALGTQSRGGFLACAAMGLVLWYRSNRKMVTGMVIALVAVALLAFMPETWEQRMGTIANYEQDGSAMGRINAWKLAVSLAGQRFTGGGFDIYQPAIFAAYGSNPADARAAHSIYFSVLGEHGYVGLLLYVALWWLILKEAAKLRRDTKNRPELAWIYQLAGMCQVALVGYLVGGGFLQLAYFDLPYNIAVVLVVTRRWLKDDGTRREKDNTLASGEAAAAPSVVPAHLPGPRP